MTVKATGWLIANTGICDGNYKFWSSKSDCDSWFKGKSIGNFNNFSVVKAENPSMHGWNAGSVHINMPIDNTTEIDYIGYQNSNDGRIYWNIVSSREYVNENSTRLHFLCDYVASFFDTIKLGKCFIERSHVNDDGYYKYNNPEPINFNSVIYQVYDATNSNDIDELKTKMEDYKVNVISAFDETGNTGNFPVTIIGGDIVGGYVLRKTFSELITLMNKHITLGNRIFSRTGTLLEHFRSVFIAPSEVSDKSSPYNKIINVKMPDKSDEIKHYKTLNYITCSLNLGSGKININPVEMADENRNVKIFIRMTGGSNGKLSAGVIRPSSITSYGELQLDSPSWPQLMIVGNAEQMNAVTNFIKGLF